MHQEKIEGLTVNRDRSIAISMIVVGVVFGAVALILDLNGGPSWLHAITWVGGGSVGIGVGNLIRATSEAHRLDPPHHTHPAP